MICSRRGHAGHTTACIHQPCAGEQCAFPQIEQARNHDQFANTTTPWGRPSTTNMSTCCRARTCGWIEEQLGRGDTCGARITCAIRHRPDSPDFVALVCLFRNQDGLLDVANGHDYLDLRDQVADGIGRRGSPRDSGACCPRLTMAMLQIARSCQNANNLLQSHQHSRCVKRDEAL